MEEEQPVCHFCTITNQQNHCCFNRAPTSKQHFFGATHDLKYAGINIEMVKAFISLIKKKKNRKHTSYIHTHKFNDVIIFGAEEAKEELSDQYRLEIKVFLK